MSKERNLLDLTLMQAALEEAKKGFNAGGIPIGSVLVVDNKIVGRGHNQRVQKSNPVLHGEMDALQNAGRLSPDEYRRATIYTTLSPCHMCSGAVLLYKIPRVVLAENRTFLGAESLLREHNVDVINLDIQEAYELMQLFIKNRPDIWNEDISVTDTTETCMSPSCPETVEA